MLPRGKIKDNRYDLDKAFEELKHKHPIGADKPTRLDSMTCQRCKFDKAEDSLTDKIKNMKQTDTVRRKNSAGNMQTYTFKEMKVKRGRFDDCMGWVIIWQ